MYKKNKRKNPGNKIKLLITDFNSKLDELITKTSKKLYAKKRTIINTKFTGLDFPKKLANIICFYTFAL